ncbi:MULTISPECIES: hypothetical protein [Mumia]|uniref:hypothetical protein n=1 Tax=Mumia TaxID=1546255 RepID=UPI00141F8A89|nr:MULTISPECIES: hypothetical protein [unclassified Mumia]QMW66716.1 hypothetical protein H4N58_01730 [Mumia sp. ZJ1417]
MRGTAAVLVALGVLVVGCGATDGSSDGESAQAAPTSASAPTPVGGQIDPAGYESPEAVVAESPVALIGAVAAWEKGPQVALDGSSGGEPERLGYSVLVVDVDHIVKDEGGLAAGDRIYVPVADEVAALRALAPVGANVAFVGGADTGLAMFDADSYEVSDADAGVPAGETLLWASPQGVVLETETGALVHAEPSVRDAVWDDVASLPAEEQFGMVAQRLMALARG